jgi:hypothetical protein
VEAAGPEGAYTKGLSGRFLVEMQARLVLPKGRRAVQAKSPSVLCGQIEGRRQRKRHVLYHPVHETYTERLAGRQDGRRSGAGSSR